MSAAVAARPRPLDRRALLAGGAAALAIGYLTWSGLRATIAYYLTVSELLALDPTARRRPVRVAGRIVDGTLAQDAGLGEVAFRLADAAGSVAVRYRGVKPDMLGYADQDAYQDVVVEGRLGDDGVLYATALIVRHGAVFEARR